jgi:hypothetical protein
MSNTNKEVHMKKFILWIIALVLIMISFIGALH